MNCGPIPCPEQSLPALALRAQPAPRAPWVLVATILGSSMDYIDGTVVNVALPSIQHSFSATGTQLQWVVEAYALFLSSLLLTAGSLGDRFGRRRMFLLGNVVFACASLGCGLAHHIGQLLFARCLQGIGGALLVPNSLALLSAEYEGPARAKAIGTWSGFSAVMTGLGPVLGGWLVQHGSWRWAFFLNLPIAAATLWITLTKISDRESKAKNSPLDIAGALLATAGLGSITYSLLEWSGGQLASRVCGVVGLALLSLFVITERRSPSPLVSPQLFLNRNFTGANLLTFFLYGSLSATLFLPAAESYSDSGVHSRSDRSSVIADGVVDVFSLSLGQRPALSLGSSPPARPWPLHHGARLHPARASASRRLLLDDLLPRPRDSGTWHDHQRRSAHNGGHELRGRGTFRHGIRNEQRCRPDGRAARPCSQRSALLCRVQHCPQEESPTVSRLFRDHRARPKTRTPARSHSNRRPSSQAGRRRLLRRRIPMDHTRRSRISRSGRLHRAAHHSRLACRPQTQTRSVRLSSRPRRRN